MGGEIEVQDLKVGDRVLTLDHGFQTIKWIGARKVAAVGKFAPIEFAAGTIGNTRAIKVSPQHRMLVSGAQVELYVDELEALVAAKHLVDGKRVRVVEGGEVEYFHILFDQHEIVYAEGCRSESFHPGVQGVNGLDVATREELYALFPELAASEFKSYGDTCRVCLNKREAMALRDSVLRSPDEANGGQNQAA